MMSPSEAPQHLQGVWKRAFITSGDFRDDSTQVFWLQTKTLFGDVRIKPGTHEGLTDSLDQCGEAACAKLASQRASAGVIELSEGDKVCQWHSDLEYQPLGGPPDIGRLELKSQHQLIETGYSADYHEDWRLLPSSLGDTYAFRLSDGAARTGALLIAGSHFMFVADRAQPLAATGASLEDVIKPLGLSEQRQALQYELSYGQLAGEADASWHIMHSTLPGRAGSSLLGPEVTGQTLRSLAAAGSKLTAGVFCPSGGWQLVDYTDGFPEQPVQ